MTKLLEQCKELNIPTYTLESFTHKLDGYSLDKEALLKFIQDSGTNEIELEIEDDYDGGHRVFLIYQVRTDKTEEELKANIESRQKFNLEEIQRLEKQLATLKKKVNK